MHKPPSLPSLITGVSDVQWVTDEAEIDGDDSSSSRVLRRVSPLCGSQNTDENTREPQSTLWLGADTNRENTHINQAPEKGREAAGCLLV